MELRHLLSPMTLGGQVAILFLIFPGPSTAQTPFDQVRQFVLQGQSPSLEAQRADEPAAPTEQPQGDEPFDEGLFEDVKPSTPSGGDVKPNDSTANASPPIVRRLAVDAVVVVDYLFFHSTDRFTVKYHLNLGGEIPQEVSVLKGAAKISTDVSGYLAKWTEGQCLLKVSIAEVPYEITFRKNGETEASVEVRFPQPITEDWESLCTFLDDPNAHFNTRGSPEKWIAEALEKAAPSLNRLITPLKEEETTTLNFSIAKHIVKDENIGSAEIEGTGAVTIEVKKPETNRPTP